MPDARTASIRADQGLETSINWEDDLSALSLTLSQYEYGAVRLHRTVLNEIGNLSLYRGSLYYERRPLDNNPYHGNIVFAHSLGKLAQRAIAMHLAVACIPVNVSLET